MSTPRLVTISFSHFCEKARWSLDHARIAFREEAHLPGFHVGPVRRARGRRSTPVLVTDDGVFSDSTDIVAWAHRARPEANLLGHSDAERREIEELEERFDEELGPHARRWAYFHLLADRRATLAMFAAQTATPRHERAIIPFVFPVLRGLMRRSMKIDATRAERSRRTVDAVFDAVASRLEGGRRFLVGDSLTAADITFASLAAPALLVDHPSFRLPPIAEVPDAAASGIRAWRAHPAGEFALRIVRDHRDRPA